MLLLGFCNIITIVMKLLEPFFVKKKHDEHGDEEDEDSYFLSFSYEVDECSWNLIYLVFI